MMADTNGNGRTIALPGEGAADAASRATREEMQAILQNEAQLLVAYRDMVLALQAFQDAARRYVKHAAGREKFLAPFRKVFREFTRVLIGAIAQTLQNEQERRNIDSG